MKSRMAMISLFLVLAVAGCNLPLVRLAEFPVSDESAAVKKLGEDIYSLRHRMQNKKIGVFYFTSIRWDVTPGGKRISDALAGYLGRKSDLAMIPRAELDRIMKIQAIENASIFDVEAMQKKGRALPVDVIIIGTVVASDDSVKIGIKVVDVTTSQILLVTGTRMPATAEFTFREEPEILLLYNKSPEKIITMNKAYYVLQWMKSKQPLVFLLAVLSEDELKSIKTANAVLSDKLAVRKKRYKKDRPDVIKKIKALEDGVDMLRRYEKKRYEEVEKWKRELLARMR